MNFSDAYKLTSETCMPIQFNLVILYDDFVSFKFIKICGKHFEVFTSKNVIKINKCYSYFCLKSFIGKREPFIVFRKNICEYLFVVSVKYRLILYNNMHFLIYKKSRSFLISFCRYKCFILRLSIFLSVKYTFLLIIIHSLNINIKDFYMGNGFTRDALVNAFHY